jgi:hypothetical protein
MTLSTEVRVETVGNTSREGNRTGAPSAPQAVDRLLKGTKE